MSRIYSTIEIDQPVEDVFRFVTTPANWPLWHPSSLGVSGAADHSLEVGEQVTEKFLVVGRRGSVVWTVRERTAPHRWVFDGRTDRGGGTITYALTPTDSGTRFEREFVYTLPNRFFSLMDRPLFRPRIEAESTEALRRLKGALEAWPEAHGRPDGEIPADASRRV